MRALVLLLLTIVTPARAQTTLRMATVAPAGTAWAREIRSFAQAIEEQTHGAVRLKVYYGGIAGDELTVEERIRRDQLDGAFSGGMLCMKLAPTMRVVGVLGMFQSRAEHTFVVSHLHRDIESELKRAGFAMLGVAAIGPELVFSRQRIDTLAQLKATRLWIWDADATLASGLRALGLTLLPGPLDAAARLYDGGKVDGFVAAPAGALAFQWSAQARYLLPLRLASLDACVIVANRFMDAQPVETQRIVRDAAARVLLHLEDAGRAQDDALLGGLFARQGLATLPPSEVLRSQFYGEARAARDRMPEAVVPKATLDRVLSLLADFRAEHHSPAGEP